MKIFGFDITRSSNPDEIESLGLSDSERSVIPQAVVHSRRIISGASEKRIGLRKQSISVDQAMPDNVGGRVTRETQDSVDAYGLWNYISSKKRKKDRFLLGRTFDLDTVQHLAYDDLVELLSDLSPEISKALFDFILLCNPGFECKAYIPGTEEPHKQGQDYIDDVIFATVAKYQGTVGTFFDRLFKMIFFRGSFLVELVLDEAGREFMDFATPDTKTLEFRRVYDDIRGQVWTFGQRQDGKFVDLDLPTIRYIPIQPNPDSIEGTSLCTSALFIAIFTMAILRDTKRVIQNQGYLRLDVEIDFEKMKDTMPEEIQGDPSKLKLWAQDLLNQVTEAYSRLRPESTYIHPSSVKVNRPVGAISGDSIHAIDSMFQGLDRMIVRALKTMPILLGTNQSRSETQANREWEIYAKGIESMQHPVESAVGSLISEALIAQGILADVKMRFEQFRGAEAQRDEMVKLLKLKVARTSYDNGYISQDEAALYGADKEQADNPEPRNPVDTSGINQLIGDNLNTPDPGAGRGKLTRAVWQSMFDVIFGERMPTDQGLDDADNFWNKYAPTDGKELIDAEVQTEDVEQ